MCLDFSWLYIRLAPNTPIYIAVHLWHKAVFQPIPGAPRKALHSTHGVTVFGNVTSAELKIVVPGIIEFAEKNHDLDGS